MSYDELFERLLFLAKQGVELDRKILVLQQENDVLKNIIKYLIDNRRIDEHV
jgi:hypothetical protein